MKTISRLVLTCTVALVCVFGIDTTTPQGHGGLPVAEYNLCPVTFVNGVGLRFHTRLTVSPIAFGYQLNELTIPRSASHSDKRLCCPTPFSKPDPLAGLLVEELNAPSDSLIVDDIGVEW